ncbi:hypothetical protein KIPB_000470 [Kipferlia bialata]|uniref:FAD-binding domain-containing protein n=1 Tax=Kipferlia bialata TaxID=797122 RepID=A0A9K3CNH6_9EUKA|nr:hypothetical protein KIPB_000470 [Kipferlia bialata]|eukprot:g470.t1
MAPEQTLVDLEDLLAPQAGQKGQPTAADSRMYHHPVMSARADRPSVEFFFEGVPMLARPGEMLSTALMAAGVRVLGIHHKDKSTQGLFCANGQCGQCKVVVEGVGVEKACVTPVTKGMRVSRISPTSMDIWAQPHTATAHSSQGPVSVDCNVLVIGAGPAGISACMSLAEAGIEECTCINSTPLSDTSTGTPTETGPGPQ